VKLLHTCAAFALLACSLLAQPARIVSTFPSATETLFALGLGDRVVGVSTYCRYPPQVLALPKIGTYMKADPEKIALLRPDLVIIERSAVSLADRLSALGIPSGSVTVRSLPEVFSMIRDIGRAAQVPERAGSLNSKIQARLITLRREMRGRYRPSVLIIVGRNPGELANLIGVGTSPYLGELLEIAGGRNVLRDSALPYPHISFESVVRRNPEIILDLSMMGDSSSTPVDEERLRQPWLSHQELTAVRNGTVFGMSSEALVTPGPRVADAVELIRNKLFLRGAK